MIVRLGVSQVPMSFCNRSICTVVLVQILKGLVPFDRWPRMESSTGMQAFDVLAFDSGRTEVFATYCR